MDLSDVRAAAGGTAPAIAATTPAAATGPSRQTAPLVLAGAEDHVYDVGLSRQIADLVPDATLEVIDGVGHSPLLEDPAAINPRLTALLERTAGHELS